MSRSAVAAIDRATSRPLRTYRVLNGLVLLGVVLQGISAGIGMGRIGGADWATIHQITGWVIVLLALAAAVLTVIALRRLTNLAVGSGVLAVLLMGQSVLGEQIGENSHWTLLAVHVPLALLITALAAYLSITAGHHQR